MQKEVIILPNKKELNIYEKYQINTFLLPLKDYSIGSDVYFDIDEINELSKKYNIYVLINKFMHKEISDFINIYEKFDKKIKFIVEDIGFVEIIDKDRLVLYENHILSNYKAINYLNTLNIKNVVINNDLTINELREIKDKTSSNIYYFYVAKNMLMYSRRYLVSSYNKHFNVGDENYYHLREKVTNDIMNIKEENSGSTVRYNRIFCASKYIGELSEFNRIIDLSDIDELNTKMILENINNSSLCNLIDSDYRFLEHDIPYKVGDIK